MSFEAAPGQKVRLLVETEDHGQREARDSGHETAIVKRVQVESSGKTSRNLDEAYLSNLQRKLDSLTAEQKRPRRRFTLARLEKFI